MSCSTRYINYCIHNKFNGYSYNPYLYSGQVNRINLLYVTE